MANEGGQLPRYVRSTFQTAGRQLGEARQAYREAKRRARTDLQVDDSGKVRIVCRKHAERTTVAIDEEGRPACFDDDHPDCRGCMEDLRDGIAETW